MILVAPLNGWASALDEVPDPVFAGKVMGDGLAIDPTSGTLCAPCDGEVIMLHAAKHAVTLRARSGAEILLHIGCDTVTLGGDGFAAHVKQGQSVRVGDPLVTFDLDALAPRVRSLITPVILIGGGFSIARREERRTLAVGDFLMELRSNGATNERSIASGTKLQKSLRVSFDHGIHARPAALLAAALHGFSADVTAVAHGRHANARSAVAWMQLGVKRNDGITLIATGPDAAAALAALEAVFDMKQTHARALPSSAFGTFSPHGGEKGSRVANSQNAKATIERPSPPLLGEKVPKADEGDVPPTRSGLLRGVVASRGIAIGPAALIAGAVPVPTETGKGIAHETTDLEHARGVVRAQLERTHATASGVAQEILEAHLSFIDDPDLVSKAEASIARGKSAGFAWREAIEASANALRAVGDPRVAERADDLRDLARQLLRALAGESPLLDPPEGSILIGQELLPSQLVGLPAGRIAGFCTAVGGPTSHVALLAAAMNLPALVAAGPHVLEIAEGTRLVLDAELGLLRIAPDAAELQTAADAIARLRSQREEARVAAQTQCRLASGERIEIFANVGALSEVRAALEQGAEGCGLLRTEFLFLDRDTPPDLEQQTDAYQSIVDAFAGAPVVIRTLDAGSDKPLRYLPLPHEENPALGIRGVRASLRNPDLLRTQLHAILRVEPLTACRILVPMITDVAEVERVRQILNELGEQLGCPTPPLGVMIETPASALLAGPLAVVADFLSIGSNDLSQYTLAIDRGHAELAAELDALHPAVLRLIHMSADAARAAGRPIAVCGGLASDPLAAPLLVGLGVDELSAVPSAIPEIKAKLRGLRLDECRALAEKALKAPSAAAVHALVLDAGGHA